MYIKLKLFICILLFKLVLAGNDPIPLGACGTGSAGPTEQLPRGQCSLPVPSNPAISLASVSFGFYSNGARCGECYRLIGPKSSVVVMIIDVCNMGEACHQNDRAHFVITNSDFYKIAPNNQTAMIYSLGYQSVSCDHPGNINISFAGGGEGYNDYAYYFRVSLWGNTVGVKSVQVMGSGMQGFQKLKYENGGWTWNKLDDAIKFIFPGTLLITANDLETVMYDFNKAIPFKTYDTHKQFTPVAATENTTICTMGLVQQYIYDDHVLYGWDSYNSYNITEYTVDDTDDTYSGQSNIRITLNPGGGLSFSRDGGFATKYLKMLSFAARASEPSSLKVFFGGSPVYSMPAQLSTDWNAFEIQVSDLQPQDIEYVISFFNTQNKVITFYVDDVKWEFTSDAPESPPVNKFTTSFNPTTIGTTHFRPTNPEGGTGVTGLTGMPSGSNTLAELFTTMSGGTTKGSSKNNIKGEESDSNHVNNNQSSSNIINFSLLLLISFVYSQWVIEREYANDGCSGNINRVSSYLLNQCYYFSTSQSFSHKYVQSGNSIIRTNYGGTTCSTASSTVNAQGGSCVGKIFYVFSQDPSIAPVGWYVLERTTNDASPCGVYESSRHIIRPNTCISNNDVNGLPSNIYFSQGDDNRAYGHVYQMLCPNTQFWYQRCSHGTDSSNNMHRITAALQSTVSWFIQQPSLVGVNTINMPAFYLNYKYTYNYFVDYYNPNTNSWTQACYLRQNNGCQFSVVAGLSYTQVRTRLSGDETLQGAHTWFSDTITLLQIPIMNPITITSVLTRTVSFTYSAANSPSSYNVAVNGVGQGHCVGTTTCTVTGLNSGTTVSISVTATNAAGTSGAVTSSATLYPLLNFPTVSNALSPNKIVTTYSATGGVPGATLYTIQWGGVNVPGCVNTAATTCTINVGATYQGQIFVTAANDGLTRRTDSDVLFMPPSLNPIIITETRTKQITFNYRSPIYPATSYSVTVNGVVQTQCSTVSACTATGLVAGSAYLISVIGTNAAGASPAVTSNGNLLASVSVPTVSATPSANNIVVTYSATGGYGGIRFTTKLNGNDVTGCVSITALTCTITGLAAQFTHDVIVVATSDGDSQQKLVNIDFMAPVMNAITVTSRKTKSITFTYSATKSPTSYSVSVNGVAQPTCSSTTTCTVSGLVAGSNYAISITATNTAGTSAAGTSNGSLYPSVSIVTFSATPSSNKIVVTYSSTGGVPSGTTYTTKLNGNDVSGCVGITTLTCTISGLTATFSHNVSLIATNDGDSKQSLTNVVFMPPVMNPITITSIRTKSISFSYGASLSPTSYSVSVNGVAQPTCSSTTTCTVSGLTPGSNYAISITATNTAGTSAAGTSSGKIHAILSVPTLSTAPSANKIVVTYSSTGGVPSETIYTTKLNGNDVSGCVGITTLTCTITGLAAQFNHNVSITASNDGVSQFNSVIVDFMAPVMNVITVTSRKTKSITFTYSATKSPTSYSVSVNGVAQPTCSSTTTCTVSGLVAGSNYAISITATNAAGTSAAGTSNGSLYPSVSIVTFSATPSANKIVVTYSSTGGVPSGTTYTTKLNGNDVSGCVGITTLTCTISGLTATFSHNVSLIATNDGDSKQSLTNVVFMPPVMNPITITSIRTKSISFSYGASLSPTSYSVSVNGVAQPTCSSTTTCTVSGLTPGSNYAISITATNAAGTSSPATSSGKIHAILSVPTLSTAPSANKIVVTYSSTGGVPSETIYTTKLNGNDVSGCVGITTLTCTINGLAAQFNHNVSITASNDGVSQFNSVIVDFMAPVMNAITVTSRKTKSITFTYSATKSPTSYSVSVNGVAQPTCSSTTTCTVSGLVAGSNYAISITATNTAGTSAAGTSNGSLYPRVSLSTLNLAPSANKIVVTYSSTGGVPSGTTYTTKLNGNDVSGCVGITTLTCTISGLTATFSHNVSLIATNDGDTSSNSKVVDFLIPELNNIIIEKLGVQTVNFSYSATQSPSSYAITVNGIAQPLCSTKTTCIVTGLAKGSNITISITATNAAGTSTPKQSINTLYNSVSPPQITTILSANKIDVKYTSSLGSPDFITTYTTRLNGNDVSGCVGITALTCTITGLAAQFTHSVTVAVVNDGISDSSTNFVDFTAPTMNVITLIEKRTKSLSFSYSATKSPTSYSVSVNGVAQPTCSTKTTCTITGLQAGIAYSISVTATNVAGTSSPSTLTGKLYSPVSVPTITTVPVQSIITVDYNSSNGVPGETLYTTKLDGSDVIGCVAISTLFCKIEGLSEQFNHTVSVIAANDGDLGVGSKNVEFLIPIMNPITITDKRTQAITFKYSAKNSPKFYNVFVNSIEQTDCSSKTNCTVQGLDTGSAFTIVITASNNAGKSSPVQSSGVLSLSIESPTMTATPTPGKIEVVYSSTGGIPGATLYTTKLDGVNVVGCVDITTLKCSISGLDNEFEHSVTLVATNDNVSKEVSKDVVYWKPIMNDIEIIEKRTKQIKFSYSAIRNPDTYIVIVNGISISECSNTTTCLVNGLESGSVVTISITASNYVGTSSPSGITDTLYPSLETLFAIATPTWYRIVVDYSSTGGIPSTTLYTTKLDGMNVPGCIDVLNLRCNITGIEAQYNHTVTLVANNDGISKQTTLDIFFNETIPLVGSEFTLIDSSPYTIDTEWSQSSGGAPNMTFYDLSISLDNITWNVECENTKKTECSISNLIQSTLYYLKLSVKNTDISPIDTYSSIYTREGGDIDCTCGNGDCIPESKSCVCYEGWTGDQCDVEYDPSLEHNKPPVITPNPNQPEIIVKNEYGEYIFRLNRIIERSQLMEEIDRLDLTKLKWELTNNHSSSLKHPYIEMVNITMNEWLYRSNISKADQLVIKFSQVVPTGDLRQVLPPYPMTFAGESFNLTIGALKYEIDIKRWGFTTHLNTLEIETTIETPIDECYESPKHIQSDNSRLSSVVIRQPSGHFVYGRMGKRVLLDNLPRLSSVTVLQLNESSTVITTVVPYFSNHLVVDPDFSVLLDPKKKVTSPRGKCKKSEVDQRVIIGSVVGGIGAVSVAIGSALLFKKYKLKKKYDEYLSKKLQPRMNSDAAVTSNPNL